jgi:hypothetical protein
VLFKRDPRYQASNKNGFMSRMLHAASRTVLTQGDNGKTQVNYSRLAGNLTSASLANIYERDTMSERDAQGNVVSFHRRIGAGPTFRRFGMSIPLGAASNIVFDELDLDGRLGRAVRRIFGEE